MYDKTRGTLAHQAPPPSPPSPCPCRPWASRSPWPRACASACAWRGRRASSFAGAGRRCEGWAQGAEVEGGLPRDNGCASMEGSPLDGKGLGHGDHARVAALGAHHGHRCEDEARSEQEQRQRPKKGCSRGRPLIHAGTASEGEGVRRAVATRPAPPSAGRDTRGRARHTLSPMPVLPDVASTTVMPGFKDPSLSAVSMMDRARRSCRNERGEGGGGRGGGGERRRGECRARNFPRSVAR